MNLEDVRRLLQSTLSFVDWTGDVDVYCHQRAVTRFNVNNVNNVSVSEPVPGPPGEFECFIPPEYDLGMVIATLKDAGFIIVSSLHAAMTGCRHKFVVFPPAYLFFFTTNKDV